MAIFFLFFRQTTELIAYVPLFTETDKTTQAKSGQWKLSAKGPRFHFFNLFYVTYKTGRDQRVSIFFGTVRNVFFRKFFKVSKESPLQVFWYFATESMLMNPKGSPFFIFRHYATFSKFFSKKKFQKNFQILFCSQSGNSDFPVISSMKGTLWVSRKCF